VPAVSLKDAINAMKALADAKKGAEALVATTKFTATLGTRLYNYYTTPAPQPDTEVADSSSTKSIPPPIADQPGYNWILNNIKNILTSLVLLIILILLIAWLIKTLKKVRDRQREDERRERYRQYGRAAPFAIDETLPAPNAYKKKCG
jgi:hypothetical protein